MVLLQYLRLNSGNRLIISAISIALIPWMVLAFAANRADLGFLMVWIVFATLILSCAVAVLTVIEAVQWGQQGGYDILRSTRVQNYEIVLWTLVNACFPLLILSISLTTLFWRLTNMFANIRLPLSLEDVLMGFLCAVLALLVNYLVQLIVSQVPRTFHYVVFFITVSATFSVGNQLASGLKIMYIVPLSLVIAALVAVNAKRLAGNASFA